MQQLIQQPRWRLRRILETIWYACHAPLGRRRYFNSLKHKSRPVWTGFGAVYPVGGPGKTFGLVEFDGCFVLGGEFLHLIAETGLLLHLFGQLDHDFGVLDQEVLSVFTTLAHLLTVIGEPCA